MRTPVRQRCRGDRGAQAVEFALVWSLALVPLVLGLIQMGAIFYSQITITQAAREAARQVALNINSGTTGTCDSACQSSATSTAKSAAQPLTLSSTTITSCTPGQTQASQASVKLTATTLLPIFFSITVTGSASMPCGG